MPVILELSELSPGSLYGGDERFALSPDLPAEHAAQKLRALLRMDGWKPGTLSNPRAALRAAIEAVERLGILVLQSRDVATSEMRAFSLSEWPHPVIVLNGSDWPRPKLFSLLHELCHLALNASSLCDLHEVRGGYRRAEDRVEHHCNAVAAGVLMPRVTVLGDPLVRGAGSGHAWTLDELAELGQRYGASAEAVLLRLVSLQLATWDRYWQLKPELERQYAEARQRERERQQATSGGPSYFVIKARNLGYAYVSSVLDAFHARVISSLDVADYLEVRFDQLPKLERAVLR